MKHIFSYLATKKDILTRRNIAILTLTVIGLLLFLTIYDGVQEKEDLASLDDPLHAWVVANYNSEVATVMRVITELSDPLTLSIITLVGASIWAWKKREYWRPMLFVGAMGFTYVVSAVIKTFTARERPTLTDLAESHAAISYSFPSGHTIGIAVFLLVLSYFIYQARPTLRRLLLWAAGTVVGIVLVAMSRIYLGYHWLTDVSASVGLAFIILALVITADTYGRWYLRRRATSKAA